MPDATPPAVRRWRAALAAVLAWAAMIAPSPAQAPIRFGVPTLESAAKPAPEGRSPSTASPAEPRVFGLLRPEDGTVAPLPPGATYDDFLAWIAARRGPGYGISSVELTAQPAGETRLEVRADIRVVVHRDEWVRVPLAFDEAVLTEHKHEGPGECSFSREAGETGLAWSFESAGEHVLRLAMLVPVVTRSEETRLSLTTPAAAAVTNLRLNVPLAADVSAATGIIRSATVSEAATEVAWVGPGGRLDVSWRPKPVAAELANLTSHTTILPSVNGKTVQLRVEQRVAAEKGQISSLGVRLPDGYTLVDVTGTLYRSRVQETTDAGRIVTVQLSEATAGPFVLSWQLTTPLPDDGRIDIDGFSLPGTPDSAQTGQVLIGQSNGYGFQTLARASEGVQPLAMVDPESKEEVAAAHEFTQPFRLGLKVEPIPPEYAVTRKLLFNVGSDKLAIDAELTADIAKGEIKELELVWPSAGWTVSPIRGTGIAEAGRPADSGTIAIRVTGTASRISVPARAAFEGDPTANETDLELPKLRGAAASEKVSDREATLCLRHTDDFSVRVEARGTGSVRRLAESEVAAIGLPSLPDGSVWTVYKASADVTAVAIDVRRMPLALSAVVAVAVRPQGTALRVEQRIDYDIRHGDVSDLRVRLPAGVSDLRFSDAAGRLLKSSPVEGGDEAVVDLEGPITGAFPLTAEFRVPYKASDGPSALTLPLVRPSQAAVRSTSLRMSPLPDHESSIADPEWTRLQTTANDGRFHWIAPNGTESVSISLPRRSDGSSRGASISKVLLRTAIDREGATTTVADCRLERPTRFLLLGFGEGTEPVSFSWRGRQPIQRRLPSPDERTVELDLGRDLSPGTLSVVIRSATDGPPGFAETVAVDGFRFGDGVRVGETLWQVTLPESQHLFSSPRDYDPRFRWALTRGLWTRQPTGDAAAWFGDGAATLDPVFETGHRYAFSRQGAPLPLAFSVIARSLVVLVGAGTAIVLGYMFANGLVPRRGAVLVSLAAVLLLSWAFFPDQVQIFLQPAAFGLLLVSVAAAAERLLRRRQERFESLGAPPSAVDFVTILPGEGSTSSPPAAIGSEEPTVLRPGRPAAAEPVGSHWEGSNR